MIFKIDKISCLTAIQHIEASVMHVCIGNLTIIGSDNGLLPGRHQAIIYTNVGILLIQSKLNNSHWRKCLLFENTVCEMAAILSQP